MVIEPGRAGRGTVALGHPRVHLRVTGSTNERARELAAAGAPHGTLVTAGLQTAGRGRQGRSWSAPPGRALLCSLILRDPPPLLPLRAGVAVAELVDAATELAASAAGLAAASAAELIAAPPLPAASPIAARPPAAAQVKWPNDVLVDGRKVAGILVEGRPQEGWVVLGVGLNVALRPSDLEPELRDRAGSLGLGPDAIEPVLTSLLEVLERWLAAEPGTVLAALRERDALRGRAVAWADGEGTAVGIDDEGRLQVDTVAGRVALSAGEVHLHAARSSAE